MKCTRSAKQNWTLILWKFNFAWAKAHKSSKIMKIILIVRWKFTVARIYRTQMTKFSAPNQFYTWSKTQKLMYIWSTFEKKEIFQYFCKDFDLLHYVTIEANFKQYYKNSHSLQIAQENFDFVNSRFSSYFQNVNDQRLRRLGPQIFDKL